MHFCVGLSWSILKINHLNNWHINRQIQKIHPIYWEEVKEIFTDGASRIMTQPQIMAKTGNLTNHIEIRVDDKFIKALIALAERTHKNRADVIRDALNYYENALNEWEKEHKIMAEPERLEFRADPEFIKKVQDLADRDGVTRAEIVRRAVGLYEYAATLAQQGMVLKPTAIQTATSDQY